MEATSDSNTSWFDWYMADVLVACIIQIVVCDNFSTKVKWLQLTLFFCPIHHCYDRGVSAKT